MKERPDRSERVRKRNLRVLVECGRARVEWGAVEPVAKLPVGGLGMMLAAHWTSLQIGTLAGARCRPSSNYC